MFFCLEIKLKQVNCNPDKIAYVTTKEYTSLGSNS